LRGSIRQGDGDATHCDLPQKRGVIEVSAYHGRVSAENNGEGTLVERARAGDTGAFSELVELYERKVYRLAKHITQNDEDAEDVLQESFLKAYTHLDSFHGDSKFYTWLVRIAVNEALMKLRKRKSDRTVSLDEPQDTGEDLVVREIAVWDDDPEKKFSRDELGGILDEAVQSLKPTFRTVFVLRDIEELSTEDTAAALGISVPAVKSRLLRARLQLREKLTRYFRRKGDDVFAYM
jgi:RNA polymerase sigma-70 factor, ECF subfamily